MDYDFVYSREFDVLGFLVCIEIIGKVGVGDNKDWVIKLIIIYIYEGNWFLKLIYFYWWSYGFKIGRYFDGYVDFDMYSFVIFELKLLSWFL